MYMLAGPNGAGKSTLYETRIRPVLKDVPFVNADIIQRDELRDPSMTASYKAAEIAEARRREHLATKKSFVSESTFSHESKLALIDDARAAGFRVVLYHVNVRSPEISVDRVAQRTRAGGHDVPEDKIRERYARNQALIRQAALRADYAHVYDNSVRGKAPVRSILFKDGQAVEVSDRVPAWARELYATELEKFSPARLNPAAASFADAREIATKIAGDEAKVLVPTHGRSSIRRGEIVGETAQHWLQRVDDKEFVAHFKSGMEGELQLHRVYDIGYPQRGRGLAREVEPALPARALAFQAVAENQLSRDEALKRHPELRPAFNALTVAKLRHGQEPEVVNALRKDLQARLNKGEVPQANPAEPAREKASPDRAR